MNDVEHFYIRKAELSELDQIVSIVQYAIKKMIEMGIFQWDERYPTKEDFQDDIKKQQLYLGLLNDEIATLFVLNQEQDEEYANGAWVYKTEKISVIHRFCVNPSFQKQGIGRKTLFLIEKLLVEQGFEAIRLDTFSLNPPAIKMYQSLNYQVVGEAHWRKGKFFLMEKKLNGR